MPYLQFKGKPAVETYHFSLPHHTLEPQAELSRLAEDAAPSLEGNLIIEGDNLLALKALLPTHAGKVKCVFIDPPYNTGNEGWVYNDNLTQPQFKEWIGVTVGREGDDLSRHDKWCCMMYPRLKLLRELMREDGAIFVSIDDNEAHFLRMIMDEVFGAENFLANLVWQKKYATANDATGLAPMHDHILAYRASEAFQRNLLPRNDRSDKAYRNPDSDARGLWKAADYTCNKTREERPNLYYPLTNPFTKEEVWPDERRVWAYSEDASEKHVAADVLWWGDGGKNKSPALKTYLSEVQGGLVPSTWLPHEDVGHTDEAKKELQSIIGALSRTMTPKPVDLVRRLIQVASGDGDLILDSFAGSATTAHAVLHENAHGDAERRFIVVQQPYDTKDNEAEGLNICREVTAKRVRNVIEGYSYPAKNRTVQVDGLGGDFSYFTVSDRPLLGEFADLGSALPPFEQLARYIFFTETSQEWSRAAFDAATGKIGSHQGTSHYLLYSEEPTQAKALQTSFLEEVAAQDPSVNIVVYCEQIWLHRDDLRRWEAKNGKRVRPMLIPFELK